APAHIARGVGTQQLLPVRDVALLGLGQAEQDLPVGALPAFGHHPVGARLGALVGQLAAPTAGGLRIGAVRDLPGHRPLKRFGHAPDGTRAHAAALLYRTVAAALRPR